LSAVLEIVASMMLGKAMITTMLNLAVGAFAYDSEYCRATLRFTVFELTSFLSGHRME